jgi:hypothetical protein
MEAAAVATAAAHKWCVEEIQVDTGIYSITYNQIPPYYPYF